MRRGIDEPLRTEESLDECGEQPAGAELVR